VLSLFASPFVAFMVAFRILFWPCLILGAVLGGWKFSQSG
jgi:hypothetical protein